MNEKDKNYNELLKRINSLECRVKQLEDQLMLIGSNNFNNCNNIEKLSLRWA